MRKRAIPSELEYLWSLLRRMRDYMDGKDEDRDILYLDIVTYLQPIYKPPPIAKGSVWITMKDSPFEGTLMAWDENDPIPDGFYVVESEKC